MEIKGLIKSINLEINDNFYLQKTSPDGWCFLVLAFVNINLTENINEYYSNIQDLHCNLNVDNITKTIEKGDFILYTLFWYYQVSRKLDRTSSINIYKICETIPLYDNKPYIKFSKSYNYEYYVPNIQLMYVYMSIIETEILTEKAKIIMNELLRDFNKEINNFHYYIVKDVILKKFIRNDEYVIEDYKHLPMIYYCLRNILVLLKEYKIQYDYQIIQYVLKCIENNIIDISSKIINYQTFIKFNSAKTSSKHYLLINNKEIILSSIGWHYPWILLVLYYVKDDNLDLYEYFYNKCLAENGIKHDNFRVRAMSAWVLSEIFRDTL